MVTVSVIIPNYNHAPFLKQRIESVINQDFQDFELIILDDCSTDNSKEIIETYRGDPKIKHIVYNTQNSGSTFHQWNKAVALAKGELIWLAESDDVADKDFLTKLVPYIFANNEIGIVYCQSYKLSGLNEVTGSWQSWTDDLDANTFQQPFFMDGKRFIEKYLVHKNVIPNASAVLFRKKLYELTGIADTDLKTCSDWLTWLKILTVGSIAYIPEHLNYFRYHDKSVIARASADPGEVYLKKYEKRLRVKFHSFLRSNLVVKNSCKYMYRMNRTFLIKEYEREGLFELGRKKFLAGWANILIAAFVFRLNGKIIWKAIKQMHKPSIN